jgi:uncharacterized protein
LKNITKIKEKKMNPKSSKKFTVIFLLICALVSFSVGNGFGLDKNVTGMLKAGGGAVGGGGYLIMIGLGSLTKDMFPRVDITVVPGGWVGNLPRVNSKELHLGITERGLASQAAMGNEPFKEALANLRALFVTQEESFYMALVRDDFPANTVEELFALKMPLRLCTLARGSITELTWRAFFESKGMSWSDIVQRGGKMNFVTWGDAGDLVKDGHADGILAVATPKIGWAMELMTSRGMKILQWSEKDIEYMQKVLFRGSAVLPADTYPTIKKAVKCPIDVGMIVVHKDIPNDIVEAMVTSIYEQAPKFANYHSALANFKKEKMTEGVSLQFHPAAEKFFREKGLLK